MLGCGIAIEGRRSGEHVLNSGVIQNQKRRQPSNSSEEVARAITPSEAGNESNSKPVDL
jgi:hypothetical protein